MHSAMAAIVQPESAQLPFIGSGLPGRHQQRVFANGVAVLRCLVAPLYTDLFAHQVLKSPRVGSAREHNTTCRIRGQIIRNTKVLAAVHDRGRRGGLGDDLDLDLVPADEHHRRLVVDARHRLIQLNSELCTALFRGMNVRAVHPPIQTRLAAVANVEVAAAEPVGPVDQIGHG